MILEERDFWGIKSSFESFILGKRAEEAPERDDSFAAE